MSSPADARWRVLPIGGTTTAARAAAEAVKSALVGLVGLFAAAVLSGVLVEEVFAGTDLGTTVDLVGRASLVGVLVLGVLGLLLLGLLGSLQGPLTARALAAARRRGAPATAVPVPPQWRTARTSSARAYTAIAIPLLVILGILYLILVIAMVSSGLDAQGLGVLGGGALVLVAIWAGIPLTRTVLDGWRSRHADGLDEHWTQPHRIIAAGRELTEEDLLAARAAPPALPGSGARTLSRALVAVAVVAALAWVTLFEIVVAIAYPEATRHASRQLGDRADLGPESERLVDLLAAAGGIVAAAGAVAVAGIVVCTILLRHLEHRVLRRALADPAAVPPPHALLRRAMVPTSLPILRLLCAFAGAGAALGVALWFVDAVAELPDWDHYAVAGPELRAAGELGPWMVLGALGALLLAILVSGLLDARDQGLRDELVQRWPVRPAERTRWGVGRG